jgi:hypothetical protein
VHNDWRLRFELLQVLPRDYSLVQPVEVGHQLKVKRCHGLRPPHALSDVRGLAHQFSGISERDLDPADAAQRSVVVALEGKLHLGVHSQEVLDLGGAVVEADRCEVEGRVRVQTAPQ